MDRSEAFETLLQKIAARGDTYAYFFNRLDNPAWLAPLSEAGFFKDPPPIEEVGNGYVRFPIWPESQALVRMAGSAEDVIVQLILDCQETDNPRVHDDFADAANKMSSPNAVQLVPNILKWLAKPYKLLLPLKAGTLMERLAREGEIDASLRLGRGLLQLSERPIADARVDQELFHPRPQVVSEFDSYEFKTILESKVPGFVLATGIRGLAMLCDQLEPALLIEGSRLGGPPTDASYIWRPSITDHEQNHDWDPHDFLVTAIRDSSDLLISEGDVPLAQVADLLGRRKWHVFSRIALYLASKWIDADPQPAMALMLRRDLFSSYEVSHEYDLMLPLAFARSSDSDRRTWLGWVEEGPDLSRYAQRVEADSGIPPTERDLSERVDHWRWDRLARLPTDALPEAWRPRVEDLAARYEAPADFPVMMSGYTGSPSPVDKTEVENLTTEDVARIANDLPVATDRFPSPEEGFAAVLGTLAEEQPGKLSSGLRAFIGTRPVFVRSILSGLGRAIDAGADEVDWAVVVAVAQWIMEQPREIDGGSGGRYSDLDPGWVWTRSAIADLLEKGLRARTISPALRESVWILLQSLLSDPDAGESSDPDAAEVSLNSIRGKTMHAIFMYARWVYLSLDPEGSAGRPGSLERLLPEVAAELDARLDPSVEESRSVRAVFGVRIPFLAWLDREWVASRSERIFSTEAGNVFDPLGRAAWQSYVLYGGAKLQSMELLRPQYEIAVRQLDRGRQTADEADKGTPFGPTDRAAMLLDNVERTLADHIMVMYWHGRLGQDPSQNDLVRGLFDKGNASVRHRALEFVGRSLREAGAELDDGVRDRVQRLFEYRLGVAKAGSSVEATEVRAFGWWVESRAIDADWRTRQVLDVLRLVGRIDVDYLVVAALADLEAPYLSAALRSLVLIIRADSDGWGVYGWKDSAYLLVQRGMESGEPESIELAADAANLLIARGFHEFRPLAPVDG